ncbi:MAG: TrkA family potassium uptake protein [Chloroflexi bacterium]|nr:TrkA family potassium uptake protein [Chloroflexota bacterium]
MNTPDSKYIVILGCGRVGSELALSLCRQGHTVVVMDSNTRAFDRLGAEFRGRTVQGDALDRAALVRGGLQEADAFAAVTSSDSANVVVARVARDIFRVPRVVARVYNPGRTPIYEKLDLQTIASSSWGARRIEQLLLHPGLESVYSSGNGEVQLYEISVPPAWGGQKLSALLPAGEAVAAALARGGRGGLPTPDATLHTHDLLLVSATESGAAELRRRLHQS